MSTSRSSTLHERTTQPTIRYAIIAVLSCAAMALPMFTYAGPAAAAPALGYTVSQSGPDVTVQISNGSFTRTNNEIEIKNAAGSVVLTVPLSYRLDSREFPIKAQTAGQTLTLTPVKEIALSRSVDPSSVEQYATQVDRQIRGPQTRQQRDDEALGRLGQQISLAFAVGGFIGTAIGAAIGCIVTLPAGCIPGLTVGATVGGIVGTIAAGGPTLVIAFQQYFRTINSPFKPQYY